MIRLHLPDRRQTRKAIPPATQPIVRRLRAGYGTVHRIAQALPRPIQNPLRAILQRVPNPPLERPACGIFVRVANNEHQPAKVKQNRLSLQEKLKSRRTMRAFPMDQAGTWGSCAMLFSQGLGGNVGPCAMLFSHGLGGKVGP